MKVDGDGTLPDLINNLYPNINTPGHDDSYFLDRMILAPRNADVHHVNSEVVALFPGEETLYHSADSTQTEAGVDNDELIPVEFLNTLNASGLPISKLALKIGAPIILLRNLAVKDGLCNGTRLRVIHLNNRVIEGRILGGSHAGEMAFIPRMNLTPSDLGE